MVIINGSDVNWRWSVCLSVSRSSFRVFPAFRLFTATWNPAISCTLMRVESHSPCGLWTSAFQSKSEQPMVCWWLLVTRRTLSPLKCWKSRDMTLRATSGALECLCTPWSRGKSLFIQTLPNDWQPVNKLPTIFRSHTDKRPTSFRQQWCADMFPTNGRQSINTNVSVTESDWQHADC